MPSSRDQTIARYRLDALRSMSHVRSSAVQDHRTRTVQGWSANAFHEALDMTLTGFPHVRPALELRGNAQANLPQGLQLDPASGTIWGDQKSKPSSHRQWEQGTRASPQVWQNVFASQT